VYIDSEDTPAPDAVDPRDSVSNVSPVAPRRAESSASRRSRDDDRRSKRPLDAPPPPRTKAVEKRRKQEEEDEDEEYSEEDEDHREGPPPPPVQPIRAGGRSTITSFEMARAVASEAPSRSTTSRPKSQRARERP
jgi:hypothetical protein